MEKRVEIVISKIPLLVYVANDIVQGYAYATQWKARPAYKHSAESSIYLADDAKRRGFGAQLYKGSLNKLRHWGIHTVRGELHYLMKQVPYMKNWALKKWHIIKKLVSSMTVGYWQLEFEV